MDREMKNEFLPVAGMSRQRSKCRVHPQIKFSRCALWQLILGLPVLFAAVMAAPAFSQAPAAKSTTESRYAVLSPWAEVDPVSLKAISPRIDSLAGKKLGLFVNYKRAARPIGVSLEKRLRAMYPTSEISSFYSLEWNVLETETKNREKFTAWAKGVDAVILLVGD
jgi:hypothetical protein